MSDFRRNDFGSDAKALPRTCPAFAVLSVPLRCAKGPGPYVSPRRVSVALWAGLKPASTSRRLLLREGDGHPLRGGFAATRTLRFAKGRWKLEDLV